MKSNKDKVGGCLVGKSVTVTLSKQSIQPLFKKGEILIMNVFGKRRYNIVKNNSKDYYDILDEDLGNTLQSTLTLKTLSRWLILRKIQIIYYRIKFYYEK